MTPITPAAMITPRWVGLNRQMRPATTAIVAVSAVLAMFFAIRDGVEDDGAAAIYSPLGVDTAS